MKRRRMPMGNKVAVLILLLVVLLCIDLLAVVQVQAVAGPRRRRVAFLSDREVEAIFSIQHELSLKTRHTVRIFNMTTFDFRTSKKWDLIVLDRRLVFPDQLSSATNLAVLDTDLLLDTDAPILTVPAPLSPYGAPEEDYKESTFTRVLNALNRLKFHLSRFNQARKLPRTLVTISTTSFVLESNRMMPPWLTIIGDIRRVRPFTGSLQLPKPADGPFIIVHLPHIVEEDVLRRAIATINLNQRETKRILIVTAAAMLKSKLLQSDDIESCIDCDLFSVVREMTDKSYSVSNAVLTTGEVDSVLKILSIGFVPVVMTQPNDVRSREMATILKRRRLGVGLFEESFGSDLEQYVTQCCMQNARVSKAALASPSETSGLQRATEILEALAENPSLLTRVLIPEVPIWYQYWFLDVYMVYGLVMVSVFVLAGSLTSGASSLLL